MKNLGLNLLADDGAVIFLNGIELLRYNLSDGPISEATYAITRAGKSRDEIIYKNFSLPVGNLIQGENVISVIVSQVKARSSDMRFDLQLKVY